VGLKEADMKIEVNMKLCELHGQCEYLAPEVFRLTEDTLHYEITPDEALRQKIEKAAKACPQMAIKILE
jgi:ferredoxin